MLHPTTPGPGLFRLVAMALLPFLVGSASTSAYAIDYREYPRKVGDIVFGTTRLPDDESVLLVGDEYDVEEVGGVTYVAFGLGGLEVYDGDVFLGGLLIDAFSIALTTDPNCVWVGGIDEVRRLDVSDPENPMVVETIPLANAMNVHHLSYSSGTLVAHGDGQAYRVRLGGPCGPHVATDAIPGVTFASIASDSENGVAAFVGGVVLGVGDIDQDPIPSLVPVTVPGGIEDVAVNGDKVLVVTSNGIRQYSATNPPILQNQNTTIPNIIQVIRGQNGVSIVLDSNGKLHAFTDTLLRLYSLAGLSDGVTLGGKDGSIVVRRDASLSNAGVSRYQAGNGMAPAPAATVEDVVVPTIVSETWEYAAGFLSVLFGDAGNATGFGLIAMRLTPNGPELIDEVDASAVTKLAKFQGGDGIGDRSGAPSTYFAVGSLLDFKIVDATDPTSLAIVGSLPGSSSAVAASEDGAVVLRSRNTPGFQVVDVSDPASPFDRGFVPLPNAVNDMVVEGTWGIVATTGLTARYDVSNPDAPFLEHATGLAGIRSVAASASPDRFYLGSTETPRRIVLYDFATQTEVSSVNVGAGELSVFTSAPSAFTGTGTEIVYASDADRSMFVIDWSDPLNPELVGEYTDPALVPRGISASHEFVVLANGSFPGNLLVLPAQDAGGATDAPVVLASTRELMGTAWPNPFTSSTSIEMVLDRARDVRVDVYDVRGRQVQMIASGPLAAGRHVLSWDGTRATGAPVASGVYFVRAAVGDVVARKKLVVVR